MPHSLRYRPATSSVFVTSSGKRDGQRRHATWSSKKCSASPLRRRVKWAICQSIPLPRSTASAIEAPDGGASHSRMRRWCGCLPLRKATGTAPFCWPPHPVCDWATRQIFAGRASILKTALFALRPAKPARLLSYRCTGISPVGSWASRVVLAELLRFPS